MEIRGWCWALGVALAVGGCGPDGSVGGSGDSEGGETTQGPSGAEMGADGATSGGETSDGAATDGAATDGAATDGAATDGGQTDGGTTDGATTDGEPTDGEPTDGEPTDGEPTDGEPTDGEPTDGEQNLEVSGVVIAGVAPSGDGMGTLYVGLVPTVDCFDGDTDYVDIIDDADLSEIGNEVPFSITVPAAEISGNYLLQVFLDDDDDATSQDPGSGDMTIEPSPSSEETAGCFDLPPLGGDVDGLMVELDYILP